MNIVTKVYHEHLRIYMYVFIYVNILEHHTRDHFKELCDAVFVQF